MRNSRRDFVKKITVGTAGFSLGGMSLGPYRGKTVLSNSELLPDPSSSSGGRPNIVFICSDTHNPKYAGYAGHPLVKTPNLDKISAQGVNFANTYCGNPLCTPGRASMMTGMYACDTNSFCNATVWDGSYPTWGTLLGNAGYYCRAIGKLDLNHKIDCGFEEMETTHGHSVNPDFHDLFRHPSLFREYNINGGIREERHRDFKKFELTMDFLKQESNNIGKPWALYVGFNLPHPPYTGLKKYYDMYPTYNIDMPNIPPGHLEDQHPVFKEIRRTRAWFQPEPEQNVRAARAGYYSSVSELDEYVGKIWSELERTGQLNNTVFIYTSDHGGSIGEHGIWTKLNLYDDSARVPLIISAPGLAKGAKIEDPVGHVDLIATILEIGGVNLPSSLRGTSLIPLINGESKPVPEFAFSECHAAGSTTGGFVIRKGNWKYIHFTWYDGLLFNIAEDPGEFNNLISNPEYKDIVSDLKNILYSQIEPQEVTLRGYKTQEDKLQEIVNSMSREELAKYFGSRLNSGEAYALAAKCKL